MHCIALVAQDVQDAPNAETLKRIFTKVDCTVKALRISPARQCKWIRIIEELKNEKALDKDCPYQLISVRTNYELLFSQDLLFSISL